MAITNVRWDGGGYDIHLLVGENSQPLNQKLAIERQSGGTTTSFPGNNLPAGVTVQFVGEFKGAPSAHGVTLNTAGQITIANALPATRLHNFIVRAEVTETGVNTLDVKIRVHVHESIQKIWLTSDTLTLYHGTTDQQFTVLAEFDDGTFGDITGRSGLAYTSSQTANVTVAADGKLTSVQANQSSDITVTFGPLPAPADLTYTATVNTKPSLAQARSISRVRGRGPVNFTNKVNILFVADGLQNGEKGLFNQIIDRIVNSLQTDGATYPYNELKDSINYWRLEDADFVASADQGVSILAEMDTLTRRGGSLRGESVPFPVEPLPTAATWTLANLIYKVGLPVPADRTKSRATKLSEWGTLYDGISAGKISNPVFNQWRNLNDRKLLNERDSAFGIRIHDYPRVDLDPDRFVTFHSRRTTASQFQDFLANLQHGGSTVGTTWTTGKDKGLVCVIARSAQIGGSQDSTLIAFTLGESLEERLRAATGGRRGIDLTPMNLTSGGRLTPLHPAIVPVVAHECAHAFGLQDEYGGGFQFPPHLASNFTFIGNVQVESELIPPAPATGLDATKIKWLWPRAKAAGVLNSDPTPSGGNFTVVLVSVRVGDYAVDDIVRLRKKDFIGKANVFSDRFKIINITGNQLTIAPLAGSTLNPADFPAGSVLIATVPGTPTPPAMVGDDLPLVAPIIRDHIDSSNGPLNAPARNPTRACAPAADPQSVMTPTNLPAGLPRGRPRNKANIVGIYEGGAYFDCRVFHPVGLCMMRRLREGGRTARFCHVCRYFIIGRVDPVKHKELDTIYAGEYPEP